MKANPLADLKPVIAPPAIPWWPPAPGWWIVGIILAISLIALAVWSWKRIRHYRGTRYQREALHLLDSIRNYSPDKQLQDVAAIMRRAAICAWGREKISTQSWEYIVTLSQQEDRKKTTVFDDSNLGLLTHSLYSQESVSTDQIKSLQQQAKVWVRTLPAVEN